MYAVKTTYVAKANHPHREEGTTNVYYTGKGGRVTTEQWRDSLEGWSRKHFAEKHIERFYDFIHSQDDVFEITEEVVEL